jgi:hypothetical protein
MVQIPCTNGKMRPVETILGMGERRMMEGVNSSMIHCKNLCIIVTVKKCHNVPPAQQ